MKRTISILALTAFMVAVIAASALPAFAAPQAGAGCKGLLNAIAKQTEHRPGGPNPVLVAKATERGCTDTTTPTTPTT
jgi:hypothetical protein